MAAVTIYIIIAIAIAGIITLISLVTYNKRLEKITKGELHDTHSKIPEPGTTAGVTYKTVLIGLTIVIVLSVSRLNGMIDGLNNTINYMKGTQHQMEMEILSLQDQLAQSGRLVAGSSWTITGEDLQKKTVDLQFSIELNQYSEDTRVTLGLGTQEITLKKTAAGTFSGTLTTDLFAYYDKLKIFIGEGNHTTVETEDFQQYLFWDVLPLPFMTCQFDNKDSFGKIKCNGWYCYSYELPEKLEKVTVTYIGDGKELKTVDVTSEVKEGAQIQIDKDLTVEKYLALRTTVITKDGYRIESQNDVVFKASPEYHGEDYERIYDAAGNLVWDNEKYN
ncbi:MAG: hypothetical protein II743_02390 [Lachnospiraceae bacterium]|nr:hypothetical protein [Lachnospiraceae bacterium]